MNRNTGTDRRALTGHVPVVPVVPVGVGGASWLSSPSFKHIEEWVRGPLSAPGVDPPITTGTTGTPEHVGPDDEC